MIDQDESVLHLVHRVWQIGNERYAEARSCRLTGRQLAVLRALAAKPGASQHDLARATGIDRSTMSAILKRLILRKLVKRRRDHRDARAYAVQLTDVGRETLASGLPTLQLVESSLFEALSTTERDIFLAMLRRILAAAAEEGHSGQKVA